MKTFIRINILLFLISDNCNAQSQNKSLSKLGITFIGLHYSFEKQVDFNKSLLLSTELSYDFYKKGGLSGDESGWGLTPLLFTEPRWYYNLIERQKNNRKTVFNAANYLGVIIGYRFRPIVNENIINEGNFFIVPNIGFQRTIGNKISIDPKLGYAFLLRGTGESSNSVFLDLRVSFIL